MANVQRENVFLTISEEEVSKYLAKGFNLVDDSGKVLKYSIPTDLRQLQKEYSEQRDLIKQKDSEIAKLKAELQALKSAGVKKTPAVEPEEEADTPWDDWADAEEVEAEEPKPKRKSSKSKN